MSIEDIDSQQPVGRTTTEEGANTEIDVEQFIQKIPQEEITSIVDTFSSLYDIKLSKEVNPEVYAVRPDLLSAYRSSPERITEFWNHFLGIKLEDFFSEEKIQEIADKVNGGSAILGQYSRYTKKVLLSVVPGEEFRKQTLVHEVIHSIAHAEGGSFKRIFLFSDDDGDSWLYKSTQLNEGATELLAFGIVLGTTDLIKIKEEVKKHIDRILEGSEEEDDQVLASGYIVEVWGLIQILEEGGVSMKELASAYIRGDAKYLVDKVKSTIKDMKSVPKENQDEYLRKMTRINQSSKILQVPFLV